MKKSLFPCKTRDFEKKMVQRRREAYSLAPIEAESPQRSEDLQRKAGPVVIRSYAAGAPKKEIGK